jgi:hypothetical protein
VCSLGKLIANSDSIRAAENCSAHVPPRHANSARG